MSGSDPSEQATGEDPGLAWMDLERYPLSRPDDPSFDALVARVQADLDARGCAVVERFIRDDALSKLAAETAALAPRAHFTRALATVYGGEPDADFEPEHPRRRTLSRENGFVAGDLIDPGTILRAVYHSPALKHFLARCLNEPQVHEFADPLAQLVVNVVRPEHMHAWHFDTNEFIVTLLTQPPETGGEFQYAPAIRAPGQENYEHVRAILDGDLSRVRTLALAPGDMQIFFGRYSLHRVAPTTGSRDRYTAIMSYSRTPGLMGQAAKTRKIFGRSLDTHNSPDGAWKRDDDLTD